MPLVRIDLREGRPPAEREAIGAAVHHAMTETLDVPHDDVFQVIAEHGPAGLRYDPSYLGIERDDGIVFVQITMRSGRTRDQKRALYRRVTELLEERAGVRPANVLIVIAENGLEDWSFGEGRAQLVDQP